MRFTTWTSAPWSNWVNHRGRAAAQPSICCQQQWKREEAGARDSFQLPKGKVVLGKAPDPHPQALQLRLHPGSLDDLHHLALLPLSDTTAPGSHYYLPPVITSHPESPCLAGCICSPHVRLCSQMCCLPAQPAVLRPFHLSYPHKSLSISLQTPHQLFQAASCLPFPTSLSSSLSSLAPRSDLLFAAPSPSTCFFASFTFRCPIHCSWTWADSLAASYQTCN